MHNQNELLGMPADAYQRKFTGVWIPAEIWEAEELSGLAKMLYADIACFGQAGCWKKSEELMKPLGVKREAFQALCRQLKDGGFITERRRFGRVVRTTTLGFDSTGSSPVGKPDQSEKPAVHQSEKPAVHQSEKPAVQLEYSKNKERIYIRGEAAGENVKKIDKKVDIGSQDVKETAEPERYGNKQVNDFLDRWHDATANDVSKIKRERNAAYNLIKSQTPEGLTALLEAVKDAFESMDKYAPVIRKPSDLVGQYSKLDKLRAWVARKEQAEPTAPSLPYYKDFQFDDYEPDDETREAIKAKATEIRASGRFKWLGERSTTNEQGGAE